MKLTLCPMLVLSLVLISCSSDDPDYEAYKKQQEAAGAVGAPYGPNADPYGAEAANPYGTPGSEVGSYQPAGEHYQPLPSVNPDPTPRPLGTPPPGPSFPTIPSEGDPGLGTAPLGTPQRTTPHEVKTGDTLWGLARQYGTTVEAIKQAKREAMAKRKREMAAKKKAEAEQAAAAQQAQPAPAKDPAPAETEA